MSDPSNGPPQIKVQITVGEESIDRDVNQDLQFDPTDLDKALIEHPAIYAYYASLTQKANLLAADAKFEYEKAMAMYSRVAREELAAESTKRVTDKQLSAIIDSQPKILALKRKYIHLENQSHVLYSLVKGLEHKKECLMQLCNNRRKEMEHLGMRVMSPRRNDPPVGASD